jgi:putative transposase
MDLYLRRMVSWHMAKRMTTDWISQVLMKVCDLRQPAKG